MKQNLCKILLVAGLIATGGLVMVAEDTAAVKRQKRTELEQQVAQLNQEMVSTRAKLIKSDEQLAELHRQILEMQRELMLKIDGKKEMQEHLRKMRQLQNQLKELDELK
ncbi:MAG: hypothetical protein MST10_04265 [Lentisphaeria bacterium]|nr:hypothetical protein [Lentisphaeria bacterium]